MQYDPLPDDDVGASPKNQPAGSTSATDGSKVGGSAHSGFDPIATLRKAFRWTLPVAAAAVLGILLGIGFAAAIHMPKVDSVSDFTPGLITRLSGANGRVFREYYRESRVMLKEGELPDLLQNALIASEDQNFLQHGGIDAWGVLRAALVDLRHGRKAQGASTITMQLARMIFLTRETTWKRKIEESFLAVELEKTFSKQQILTLYANLIPLGHGTYGVEAAAQYFFNKSVDELTLAEAATIVGIIPRPSDWSPHRRPEKVQQRRDVVLARMLDDGFITQEEHDAAVAGPLLVVKSRPKAHLGPYFAEDVRRYLYSTYGETGLYERGLQVKTTMDPDMQRAAESALRRGLERIDRVAGWRGPLLHLDDEDLESQELPSWGGLNLVPGAWVEGIVLEAGRREAQIKIGQAVLTLDGRGIEWTREKRPSALLARGDVAWFRLEVPSDADDAEPLLALIQEPELEGAVVLLESATGAVRAMVGGWDFQRNEFNRAVQARRQVGSAFKPFVLGAALEVGFTPADTLFDAPVVFAGTDGLLNYSPRNYYFKYYGILTLRRAIELSINVTAVKLLDLVGVDRVVDFARRCGIRSPLPPYPSLALGSADLSPMEMAASYAAIANQGIHVEPYLIDSVSTPDGRILESHLPRANKAMEPEVAFVLTQVLNGVIRRGTGVRARDLNVELAGKTGTTDAYTDAWFIGYSPKYTLVVWVGHDLKRPIGRRMTGAEAALPIWREIFAKGLEAGWVTPGAKFHVPPGVTVRPVEHRTGLLPTAAAEHIVHEAFVTGTEPVQEYEPHWAQIMSLPWYQQRIFYGIPKEGENMPEDIEDWDLVLDARYLEEEGEDGELES